MKRILSVPFFIVLVAVFAGCHSSDYADNVNTNESAVPATTTANDTTLSMSTNTNADNSKVEVTPNVVSKDSTATASPATTVTATPNPAKKGKKGLVVINTNTKSSGDAEAVDKEGYYTNVYPAYPGGNQALAKFFEKNIQYPADASDNGVEGTVNLSFTVDETGKVGKPQITSPKLGYGLEEEALRVFNKMTAWKPGSLKGRNVKTRFTLPVKFTLTD